MKLKRIKTGKTNRWKKGHSCASNPTTTRFRELAKYNIFSKSEGVSNLTVNALAQHAAALSVEPQLHANADDDMTVGGTFNTFATKFTSCTIPDFERFFRNFSSVSELQTKMLAIHAAAQEYIQEEKLPETSTSYMCALMKCLEGIKDQDEEVTATLSLLAKVIRKVSRAVLINKFSEYSKLLQEVLHKYSESPKVKLINNVIGCLSILLRSQNEIQWTYKSTSNLFQEIMCYTTHKNSDIRRSAQYNVSAILRGSSFMSDYENEEAMEVSEADVKSDLKNKKQSVSYHPAACDVKKFILTNLKLSTANKNGNATLYLLILLQLVINSLPEKELKPCCEEVLNVMYIGDNVVKSRSLKVFGSLFSWENNRNVKPALSTERAESIINALTSIGGLQSVKFVPSLNNPELCTVWMNVVASGIVFLSKKNKSEGLIHYNKWIEQLTSFWKSDYGTIHEKVWHTNDYIFDECVKPLGEEVSIYSQILLDSFKVVEKCVSLQFEAAWPYVFRTLGLFFSVLGQHCHSEMSLCLQTLSCHMSSQDLNGRKELEGAISSAIVGMGPEHVMEVVPLKISGEIQNDEINFWILPLLKKYVKNCRLSFFVSHFIPMTNQCFLIIKSLTDKGKGDSLFAKAYKQVECQIWSLLPSFSDGALDIKEALSMQVHSVNPDKQDYTKQSLAQLFGNFIKSREDTRLEFLTSLRNLLKCSSSSTIMAHFSKNFLPILFNVYLLKPREKFPGEPAVDLIDSGQRLAAFETIKCYLSIVPVDKLKMFYDLVMKKYNDESDIFKKKSLMNMAMLFVPYLGKETLLELYVFAKEHIEAKKSDLQKTSYRILEEIVVTNTNNTNEFLREHLEEMFYILFTSSENVAPNARAPRVKCYSKLLPYLQLDISKEKVKEFFKHLFQEAVEFCGRKNSSATRKAGYTLIRDIGMTIQRIQEISDEDCFDYIMDLLPSFTPITDSTANIIYVLTILHFMYDDVQNPKIVKTSIPYISSMLSCENRVVVTSCLSFIRVSFSRCLPIGLNDSVDLVAKHIIEMPSQERLKFRKRIRDILASFVRKFNADRIRALVPENDPLHKVITNLVKKDKRRKKKKTEQTEEDSDSDDELTEAPATLDQVLQELEEEIEDDNETGTSKHKNKKKKSDFKKKKQTWIEEDEDEIIDFLDPESCHKITSKKPREKKLRFDVPPQTEEEKEDFKFDKKMNKYVITKMYKDVVNPKNHNEDDDDDDEKCALEEADVLHLKNENDTPVTKVQQKKRKRNVSQNSDSGSVSVYSHYSTSSSFFDSNKKLKKFDYGAEFRSKKAGGDVVKKGGNAPYAYVQLSKEKLNRRKSAKYAGQFKSLVKGAKRGANKGTKSRTRSK